MVAGCPAILACFETLVMCHIILVSWHLRVPDIRKIVGHVSITVSFETDMVSAEPCQYHSAMYQFRCRNSI